MWVGGGGAEGCWTGLLSPNPAAAAAAAAPAPLPPHRLLHLPLPLLCAPRPPRLRTPSALTTCHQPLPAVARLPSCWPTHCPHRGSSRRRRSRHRCSSDGDRSSRVRDRGGRAQPRRATSDRTGGAAPLARIAPAHRRRAAAESAPPPPGASEPLCRYSAGHQSGAAHRRADDAWRGCSGDGARRGGGDDLGWSGGGERWV